MNPPSATLESSQSGRYNMPEEEKMVALNKVLEVLEDIVKSGVKFMKFVPGFKALDMEDQICLFKGRPARAYYICTVCNVWDSVRLCPFLLRNLAVAYVVTVLTPPPTAQYIRKKERKKEYFVNPSREIKLITHARADFANVSPLVRRHLGRVYRYGTAGHWTRCRPSRPTRSIIINSLLMVFNWGRKPECPEKTPVVK